MFISAVSAEFRERRERLSAALVQANFEVIDEENITVQPDSTKIKDLDTHISRCQVFIMLVGSKFGNRPTLKDAQKYAFHIPNGLTKRPSYTIWELLLAQLPESTNPSVSV